jgi:hypothetical protein
MWSPAGRSPRRRNAGAARLIEAGAVEEDEVSDGSVATMSRCARRAQLRGAHRAGPSAAKAGAEIADLLPRPRTWIVTERNVAALHLGPSAGLRRRGIEAEALVLPPGEGPKAGRI